MNALHRIAPHLLPIALLASGASAGPLETIGPWSTGTLPSSVQFVSGGFSNGWTSVTAEAPTEDEIFRSLSLIDRGGANLLVGTVIELAFPVPVVNRAGPDLVLFAHFDCFDELYRLSADHDGYAAEFDLEPEACTELGMREYYVENNAEFFLTTYTASPIDLAALGVPIGGSIGTLRLAQVEGQPDPLGVAALVETFSAADDAADPAYDDGWQSGDDGGFGWDGAWFFSSINDPDDVTGFGITTSTANGDGDDDGDGDIDTDGRAFELLTADIAQPNANRPLQTLAVGQTLRFELDTEPLSGSSFLALNLLNPSSIGLDVRAPGNGANYRYSALSGFVDTGVPVNDEGVHVAMTLTGPADFTLVLTPLDGTPSVAFDDTLSNIPVEALRFSFQGSGDPAEQRGWVNAISVPEPGGAAGAAALAALVWLALARRAYSPSQSGGVGGPKAL